MIKLSELVSRKTGRVRNRASEGVSSTSTSGNNRREKGNTSQKLSGVITTAPWKCVREAGPGSSTTLRWGRGRGLFSFDTPCYCQKQRHACHRKPGSYFASWQPEQKLQKHECE